MASRPLCPVSSCHHSRPAPGLIVLTLLAAIPQAAGAAEGSPPQGSLAGCLNVVVESNGAEISCDYAALLTPQERADVQRLTRGLLQDVNCLVEVRIARAPVEAALTANDIEFKAPPQPVHCDVKTKQGGFPIDATFAPAVTFKGGKALAGSPGLSNVTGVNAYLAWPVVQYVNRSPGIRASMLDMINTLRPKLAKRLRSK